MKLPILILIYNRTEISLKLINAILLYKPKLIDISSDGPKDEKDKIIIDNIRRIIEKKINNNCKFIRLYSHTNLGLKKKVHESIDFFFSKEKKGIILEDDCIPNLSFFKFCEQNLTNYQYNSKISMITGTNLVSNLKNVEELTYYFSQYFNIWGWATWSDRWNRKKSYLNKKTDLNINFNSNLDRNYQRWAYKAFKIHKLKSSSWAMDWFYDCLINDTYAITPSINLIQNIGLNGTHTFKFMVSKNLFHKTYNFKKIKKRKKIIYDYELDNLIYFKCIHENIFKKIFYKLVKAANDFSFKKNI